MAGLSFLACVLIIFEVVSSIPIEQAQDLSVDMVPVPESTTVTDEIDSPTASPDPLQDDDLRNAETALGFIGIGIPVYGGYGGFGGGYGGYGGYGYRRPYYGGGWGGGYGHHHHHHGHWGGHHGHGHWG